MPIRTPTDPIQAQAYWRRMAYRETDGEMPDPTGLISCGYYRFRMVKGGPWLPVCVYLHAETDDLGELTEPETHMIAIFGQEARPLTEAMAENLGLHVVTEEEYRAMLLAAMRNMDTMAATKAKTQLTDMDFSPPKRTR